MAKAKQISNKVDDDAFRVYRQCVIMGSTPRDAAITAIAKDDREAFKLIAWDHDDEDWFNKGGRPTPAQRRATVRDINKRIRAAGLPVHRRDTMPPEGF